MMEGFVALMRGQVSFLLLALCGIGQLLGLRKTRLAVEGPERRRPFRGVLQPFACGLARFQIVQDRLNIRRSQFLREHGVQFWMRPNRVCPLASGLWRRSKIIIHGSTLNRAERTRSSCASSLPLALSRSRSMLRSAA